MKKPKTKIDPNQVKARDYLMVKIIQGVTKSGVHKDHKKEASKKACRKKIDHES